MLPRRAHLTGILLLTMVGPVLADPDASSLLFERPALVEVPAGSTLVYSLQRTGGTAAGVPAHAESTVELSLQRDPATGEIRAEVAIITGEGRQAAGSFPSQAGNPVLLVALERDITEMSRLLRGSPYYIRNRIREAISAAAPISARFTFDGREVEGWRIVVSPFEQDRNRDRLREHAAKRYEFILSDAVPGHLYAVRMVTPGADGAQLVEDHLGFERSRPAEGGAR
jgi:hypothetical protein